MNPGQGGVAVVIVTHNAEAVLPRCLEALARQRQWLHSVVVVDSGSTATGYLRTFCVDLPRLQVLCTANQGFARANNIGFQALEPGYAYVLFLNPDAFVEEGTLALACTFLAQRPEVGCLSGRLLGWDMARHVATGRLDSTGIFRRWYGRWYDRGQGQSEVGAYEEVEQVPAACGAFLFCRPEALQAVALEPMVVFSPDFFLYKEDIELSLRLRKGGWEIVYHPALRVYHCRGWQQVRRKMPYALRLTAAVNELLLYKKHPSPYILWALAKYLVVRWGRF